MEKLNFDRKCKCDFCGCEEICAITHYGTSIYNRLICVECAMDFNQHDKIYGSQHFDLNNSTIRFNFNNVEKQADEEEEA